MTKDRKGLVFCLFRVLFVWFVVSFFESRNHKHTNHTKKNMNRSVALPTT